MAISGTTPVRRIAASALAGLLVLGVGGCGADDETEPAAAATGSQVPETPSDGPRLVQGGEPGEDAVEVPPDTTSAPNEWNHDDVMFMQMMIPHHGQALEMSALAPARASDRRVKRLADRIGAAQGPEINTMAQWLAEREIEVPRADEDHAQYDHGEHGHAGMESMLSDTQMEQLAAAEGAAFDELFLESMIGHHEGALQMAADTAGGGLDIIVGEMRDEVTASQSAEIARMQQLLADL